MAPASRGQTGRILGLIGFGQIGRLTAERARVFGYNIIAYDPHMPAERITAGGAEPVGFEELLARADIVSLHVPATPETRNIMSAEALSRMKEGAMLINVSRGGLVDEVALANLIRRRHLAGAGIDTFERGTAFARQSAAGAGHRPGQSTRGALLDPVLRRGSQQGVCRCRIGPARRKADISGQPGVTVH